MLNTVDWPAMIGVFSCVTQYQLIISNEGETIPTGKTGQIGLNKINPAEKLLIQFEQDQSRKEIIYSI